MLINIESIEIPLDEPQSGNYRTEVIECYLIHN